MANQGFEEISAADLQQRLQRTEPNNLDPVHGYALVNVLDKDAFREEHIPHSINVPQGHENELEKRFRPDKEIIVYCASEDCPASPEAARELVDRGFRNVKDFTAGMKGWKDAGGNIATGGPQ